MGSSFEENGENKFTEREVLNRIYDQVSKASRSILVAYNPSLDIYENIDCLKNSINVHEADVHDIPINEYFHRHTGINTTLAVANLAGAISVTVVNAAGFNAGDFFQIENGIIETTFPKISAIVGNVLSLTRPLDNAFSIGDGVEVVSFEMNVSGTVANPASFKLIPDKNQNWHIVRFLFSMTHGTNGDLGLFGNLPALPNGVVLRAYNATTDTFRTFTWWDSNAKIKDDMYDVEFDTRSTGGGTYGTTGRGSIKIATGAVPKLGGAAGDYLEILIQDDLTGLISYRLKAQGHIEGI